MSIMRNYQPSFNYFLMQGIPMKAKTRAPGVKFRHIWLELLYGAVLLLCLIASAHAQQTAPSEVAHVTHQVNVMAGSCANCHGTDGAHAGAIPAIAGRPADELSALLIGFKNGAPGPANTVMGRIAKGFTDDELRLIAQHY